MNCQSAEFVKFQILGRIQKGCSIVTEIVAAPLEAARPTRFEGVPGKVNGANVTTPSIAEAAEAVCAARRAPCVQTVCGPQGGDQE